MPSNPLHGLHEQAEASFLPYGGGDLHVVESYGEVEAEYASIRKAVALMDAPHRGVVVLTGKDRLTFLHNLVTNDTRSLVPGEGVYAFLLNTKGRITMDLNVLHAEDATLVEMDTRLTAVLVKELEKYHFAEDVKIFDASDQLGRMTLIGPKAAPLLGKLTGKSVAELNTPLRHLKAQIAGITGTVFRNDLCGEEQFELIIPRDQLVRIWEVLHEAGGHGDGGDGDSNLRAIGWSAFNTARIETGTPLFGIDLTENYLPMETGHWYLRAVSLTKGCYIGQEIVARMHAHQSVARLLVGLEVENDRLPVAGTEILDSQSQVGIVTSSCVSPMLGYVPVAMGYVKKAYAAPGKHVEVLAEADRARAHVRALPFWIKRVSGNAVPDASDEPPPPGPDGPDSDRGAT